MFLNVLHVYFAASTPTRLRLLSCCYLPRKRHRRCLCGCWHSRATWSPGDLRHRWQRSWDATAIASSGSCWMSRRNSTADWSSSCRTPTRRFKRRWPIYWHSPLPFSSPNTTICTVDIFIMTAHILNAWQKLKHSYRKETLQASCDFDPDNTNEKWYMVRMWVLAFFSTTDGWIYSTPNIKQFCHQFSQWVPLTFWHL